MEKKIQYDWLDLIRGLSALAVFMGHLRIICFRDSSIGELDVFGRATYFLTGFGHLAVVIFFVLSGFLIIKSIHESRHRGSWSISNYAQNRLFRLWVVLVPSLVLGLLFDKIGLKFWGDSLFYSNQWKYFLNQDLANKLTTTIFIGNAFFLQKILVPTLGSNGALWSLTNEFWYYVIFPFLYFSCVKNLNVLYRLILIVVAILLMVFVGKQIAYSFPIWLMGGLSYILSKKVDRKYLQRKALMALFTILFLIGLCLSRMKFHENIFNTYSISFLFSLAIPFLIHCEMKSKSIKVVSKYLSDISYTLYLAHLPFIYLLTSILNFQDRHWSLNGFLLYVILAVGTLVYSTLLWYVFERNTKHIRSWVTGNRGKALIP